MRNRGKKSILGVLIDAVDYEAATEFVIRATRERRGVAISALAVHGVMTAVLDRQHKFRLNHFDLLAPDGQPVRWGLNYTPERNYELLMALYDRAIRARFGSTRR